MSSEPLASGPQPSESASNETAAADFDADAALVLAALGRMEAAIRGERDTLDRVRTALGQMADAVGLAKRSLQPDVERPLDVAMLLDELEHCIDAMLELAGDAPRGAPPKQQPRVPTVSGVVSRLGRSDDGAPDESPRQGPTVSELEAMVQALSAPAAADQAVAPTPPIPETPATREPEAAPAPAAEPIQPESELLASVAALQAQPMLPAEVGAAVIFSAKPPPETPPETAPAAQEPEPDDLSVFLFGPDIGLPVVERTPDAQPATPALPAVDLAAPTQAREPDAAAAPAKPGIKPRADPLAPINALTEAEKLALFS